MSRRAVLWIAFVAIHLLLLESGFVLPNNPIGDVPLVYEPWARAVFEGRGIVGITAEWIYPQLALAPILLTQLFAWTSTYTITWALLVTACDALAFQLLIGRARSTGRSAAAVFWLVFALLLGPVGMYRLDAVTVPLTIAGCLWLVGRPRLASVLLAVGVWIKVWPAALIAAALIAARRRLTLLLGAALTSAVVLLAIVVAGGAPHALGFVSGQTGRGLQIEAPVSSAYLWAATLPFSASEVYYDQDILTWQVSGPLSDLVAAVMTPVQLLAIVAIVVLGAVKARGGASFVRLFPPLALSLVLALIVFNKVGSPQFQTWLIAPIVLGLVVDRRRWQPPAVVGAICAFLTFYVYPLVYGGIVNVVPQALAILTARNAVLIGLLIWSTVLLARVPRRTRHPIAAPVVP